MSTERRFEVIADLGADYILAVPEDARPKDIIEETEDGRSLQELWKRMKRYTLVSTLELLEKYPTDKVSDVRARYNLTLNNRLRIKRAPITIRTTNFATRYPDMVIRSQGSDQHVLIEVKDFGRAKVNPDFIYEPKKVKVGDEERWVLFQPSKYLRDPSQIWALKHLVGEHLLVKQLNANYQVLDGQLVEQLMGKTDLPFYLSENREYIFAAPLQIHKDEHGQLKKITAKQALKYLSVPALERVVEQGSAKL